jgi:hypothetical protein
MSKWAEVNAGEVGLFVPKGTFFLLGEDTLSKVERIEGDSVYMHNGDIVFQMSQVRIIEKAI